MIKMIFKHLLLSSYIMLPSIAQSASILNPALTINPAPPLTTQDVIYAELSGDFATSGFVIDGDPLVTLSGNNIAIDFNSSSPTGIVLFVLTPFSVNADIGLLNAGTYNVISDFYVDGILEHTLNSSITVSAIPLPAAVWLFASGLIGLIGVTGRKA